MNTPPVVGKFTVQGTRANEPPNFADVSEDVPVTVEVTDADPAIADVKFDWTSSAEGLGSIGTFVGTGTNVTWKSPAAISTPTNVTLTLEVVETYSSGGKTETNRVSKATTISLHDSEKEVGSMARQFLLDFSDSNLPVAFVMRNWQPDCYGTASETSDVTINRELFEITKHDIGLPSTTVAFGGICPRTAKGIKRGDACSLVSYLWTSKFKKDHAESGKRTGDLTDAWGINQIAAMYYPALKSWRLCDSSTFDGGSTLRATLKGLVP